MFDVENSVGFLLAKAYQKASATFKEHFGHHDITPQQFGILAFLWQENGLSQSELCQRAQIDRTTMGGVIDRLEKEGLVLRQSHPEDRRAYRICLTDKGKGFENEWGQLAEQVNRTLSQRLSAAETATLKQLLDKLRN